MQQRTSLITGKKIARPLAKHWCITLNNPVAHSESLFINPLFSYTIFGREHASTGTPHLQGYVCCRKKMTLSSMRKIFGTSHLEIARGTPKQASDYCKKGDQTHDEWDLMHTAGANFGLNADFVEHGDLPLSQTEAATFKNQEIYDDAVTKAKENRIDEVNSKLYLSHYSTLKRIAIDEAVIPDTLSWHKGSPPNEWHWGPSGTGKSKHCRESFPDAYIKMTNKWWEGYKDEETVLIEDIGMTHLYLGDHLKIWADRYGFRSEVKGSSAVLRPQRIIVTSNYHPEELWTDPNVLKPLMRRFKLINYNTVNSVLMPHPEIVLYSPEEPTYEEPLFPICDTCKYFADSCDCKK